MSRPTLHSDDLTCRQDEDMEDWRDTGLIAGVFVCLGLALLVVEICRLPGRILRAIR